MHSARELRLFFRQDPSAAVFLAFCIVGIDFMIYAFFQWTYGLVMKWENVPPINLFKKNTAAFVHDLPGDAISNAAGESNYVRVQVLTPVNISNRERQLGVVCELTDIIAAAANDPALAAWTWVLITESSEEGRGINGHANTGADISYFFEPSLSVLIQYQALSVVKGSKAV